MTTTRTTMVKYWIVKILDEFTTDEHGVGCQSPEGCPRPATLTIGTEDLFGTRNLCSHCYSRFKRGSLELK